MNPQKVGTSVMDTIMLAYFYACEVWHKGYYLAVRGPMGGAPYIGPRLGGGPIFEVSVARLYAKERPGKLPTLAS